MSSERINSIDMRINKLNQEATNLKTSQYAGWDSVRAYEIKTTNEYDYSYTAAPPVDAYAFEVMRVHVKFIADHQEAPFAKPVMTILVNDAAYYRVGGFKQNSSETKDYGIHTDGFIPDVYGASSPTTEPNKRNEISWHNAITFSEGVNIKIKVKIYAMDTGRMILGVSNNETIANIGNDPQIIIS